MAVVKPDVVIISSDDDSSDGEGGFVREPDVVLIISSDDEFSGERNLEDEGFISEQDVEINELDKEEEDACIDNNCNHGSDPSNQGGSDLHALSHNECKMYLLKHGMRVSGTKEECIQRIKEHERLKDVGGESLYPRSSFSINCTGDACRGDVVLFKQNLYNSQRKLIGRRTVAGRIANESYGATTQNHTFLVEVLWSKRCKQLDPLYILLVKGCNLYRFGTYRQPWENEAERLKVLEEKHKRGKEARRKRKLRETEFASGGNKGTKRRKVYHGVPSQSKHLTGLRKHNHANKNTTQSQAVLFQNEELKGSTQLTCHPEPNCSMHSEHHIQEASLPFTNDRTLLPNNLLPFGSSGCSHHSNEQGPSQTSQSPDHHDHNSELSVDRSKDEKAKLHFPISSFSINCTGDARERDIVLFKQQVYHAGKHADKKRTVAGRIVKVRQCEARDKHRFLIKVLWTIPYMENFWRSTLLVRSRNLYKFGTFRQPWKNEAMRSQMLEEQHKPSSFKRKLKKTDIALNKNKGVKRQKVSYNGPSSSKQPTQVAKHKFSKKGATASPHKKVQKMKTQNSKQTFLPNPDMNLNPSLSINHNVNPSSDPISSTTSSPNLISSTTLNPISSSTSNPNPISSTTSNLNLISSTTSNPNPISSTISSPDLISSTTSNPNLSPHQKQNLNARQNKPNARPNPKARQNGKTITHQSRKPDARQIQNLNARQNKKPKALPNPNAQQNGKSNAHQSQNLNVCQGQNLNAHQNGKPNTCHSRNLNARENKKPNALPDPNAHQNGKTNARQSRNLNDRQIGKPSARQSQDLNAHRNQNPNPGQNLNPNALQNQKPKALQNRKPNAHQNRNLNDRHNQDPSTSQNPFQNSNQNPNLNSFVYGGQQLQESSLSVYSHRSFMPNPPRVWFPPNQQPLPLGYGGQWRPNHVFIQPPNYNYVAAQLLVSLLYHQPLWHS
ncbi:uncharacterized protein LOC143616989 [Bidens hawaiensis]|uniref:uncharacterized protein LOC143616989 n=1 Tax=Bidens hawaiensis TaxID=980011 RepID=UPI00404AD411